MCSFYTNWYLFNYIKKRGYWYKKIDTSFYLVFPSEFSEAFSSHLFEVYEAIYKEHETSQKLSDIRKFSLSYINMPNFSDMVRQSVIQSATILYRNLEMNLDAQKRVRQED